VGVFILGDIDWVNQTAEMSYGIFKPERGKGYGSDLVQAGTAFAFDVLNLRRIGCEVLANNTASIHCVEKAGYKREGEKREAVFRCGVKYNSLVYGILR